MNPEAGAWGDDGHTLVPSLPGLVRLPRNEALN